MQDAYQQVSSGSCASHDMHMVKNEEECIFATQKLGLNDDLGIRTEGCGSTCPETHRPKGCVYTSDKEVYWYNPIDFLFTSADCGSTVDGNDYDCICAIISTTSSFRLKIFNMH